jgi:GlcNAc-P-P-Und epimerase
MMPDRYLLTGGSGFLGKIIHSKLSSSFTVTTLGRSSNNDIVADLSVQAPILHAPFDVVVHNAGKAHTTPRTAAEAKAFFDVNVTGTEHLLNAFDQVDVKPRAFVFISSIAVYGVSDGLNISEKHPLRATDPYGASKIQAEQLIMKWAEKSNVPLTILRLPLLAGQNPPGNLGAMIRGIQKGYYFSIGKADARKSMVMAEDVASLIPSAAKVPGIFNLTDGYHPSFRELEILIANQLGTRKPMSIPYWSAKMLGWTGGAIEKLTGVSKINSATISKIVSSLTFDDSKARQTLEWKARKVLDVLKIK